MAQIDLSIIIPIAILAGLGFAGLLTRDVLRRDTGNDRMREITAAIQHPSQYTFIRRPYSSRVTGCQRRSRCYHRTETTTIQGVTR